MPRHYQFRTLRSDFIDLCDGNRIAALLLDYFWQQGQKLIERQMNGSPESQYIPLGWNYAILITLMPIGKNAIKRGVDMLVERAYITPHSANNQSGANVINSYRVEMAVIQADLNRWSESSTWVQPDLPRSTQTHPWVQTDPPPGSVQTHPLGLAGPHESVRESAYDSAAAAAPPPLLIADSLKAYFGRTPTPMELQIGAALVLRHGHAHVRTAIEDAASKGGRSMKYVEQIANNADPRPTAAAQPERTYFTAPEDDAPAMTAEEIAQTKAELQAMRTAMRSAGS
jgi:hypothetical protein